MDIKPIPGMLGMLHWMGCQFIAFEKLRENNSVARCSTNQQICLIVIARLDDDAKVQTSSADVALRDHVPKWQVCNICIHKR